MKLNEALEAKFNDQITLELEASVTYRQLGIVADVLSLPGMASWFRAQADEEIVHANKFIDHVVDRGGNAQIGDIPAPKLAADATVLDLFKAALAHEERVSAAIRELYRAAEEEGDIDSRPLLLWFIDEQIEEESTVSEIVDQVEIVHNDGSGLLRLDAELGERTSGGTENE